MYHQQNHFTASIFIGSSMEKILLDIVLPMEPKKRCYELRFEESSTDRNSTLGCVYTLARNINKNQDDWSTIADNILAMGFHRIA